MKQTIFTVVGIVCFYLAISSLDGDLNLVLEAFFQLNSS